MNYVETERRRIKLGDLLWEKGFRHGDHVLEYWPEMGCFKERVVTRFAGQPTWLEPCDMAAKLEKAQGYTIKPEDRTERNSQPDLGSHETSMLIYWKPRRRFR